MNKQFGFNQKDLNHFSINDAFNPIFIKENIKKDILELSIVRKLFI